MPTGAAVLTNAAGLHARPAVRITQEAKRCAATVEFATSPEGPWTDAKSPVRVMRARAPTGSTLYWRTEGSDSEAALAAMLALVRDGFGEG